MPSREAGMAEGAFFGGDSISPKNNAVFTPEEGVPKNDSGFWTGFREKDGGFQVKLNPPGGFCFSEF